MLTLHEQTPEENPLPQDTGERKQGDRLDYAPALPWRKRRRTHRVIALALIALFIASGYWWGPIAKDRIEILYLQYQCMNYEPPTGQVVYGTDGTAVIPAEWTRLYSHLSGPGSSAQAVVFMRERRNRHGARLVVYELWDRGDEVDFHSRVFEPGSLFKMPQEQWWTGNVITPTLVGNDITVLAGVPDPDDESHFSFEYIIDGEHHYMDGWLEDDGRVVLSHRRFAKEPAPAP